MVSDNVSFNCPVLASKSTWISGSDSDSAVDFVLELPDDLMVDIQVLTFDN